MAQFTNQATLSYNGSVVNSNVAVGEILEALSAQKTAVRETYVAGDTITYVISLRNAGAAAWTGLTVSDDLGAYAFGTPAETVYPLEYIAPSIQYYSNGVLQAKPTVTAGPPLVISGISVPAGGDAVLIYETKTTPYAPPGVEASITNTATITGDTITPVTAQETVAAQVTPVLSIAKAVAPVPVAENGRLTYTFDIQNTGNAPVTAADAAIISDVFAPILRDLTVTYNGAAWAQGTDYTYDAAGNFATVAGKLLVPAAAYTQDAQTGAWIVTPSTSTLTVSGTIA